MTKSNDHKDQAWSALFLLNEKHEVQLKVSKIISHANSMEIKRLKSEICRVIVLLENCHLFQKISGNEKSAWWKHQIKYHNLET